jgi:hypothetical protein
MSTALRLRAEIKEPELSSEHLYLNVCMPVDRPLIAQASSYLTKYSETRSEPILLHPEDWHLSIVRFNVPTSFIPICFMGVQGAQANINLTNYSVTLQAPSGLQSQQYLVWTPEDASVALPVGPVPNPITTPSAYSGFQSVNLRYYSLYSYQHFVDVINMALAASFAVVSADVTWPAGATYPPYMTFDSSSGLITITVQTAYTSAGVALYFNSELMEFFQSTFQTIFNGFSGVPPGPVIAAGTDYQIRLKNNGNNSVANIPNPGAVALAGYAMRQEFAALQLWTDFATLAFMTGSVAVSPEFAPATKSSTTTSGGIPIISDFQPVTSGNGTDLRTSITYVPQSEYRLVDLIGGSPMKTFDLQVFWGDSFGNYFPIFVSHNLCVSAKIMFRRHLKKHKIPLSVTHAKGGCAMCANGGCTSCSGRRR